MGTNIAVAKVADRMGNWHVGRAAAEVGIRCREATASRCSGNHAKIKKLPPMKMVKAIRQQAAIAERVAVNTADTYAANQMRALAQAFRTQAEIIKKKKKKKKK